MEVYNQLWLIPFILLNLRIKTFVPSFRLVKHTIVEISSCVIIVQKSSIVFGLGPKRKGKI